MPKISDLPADTAPDGTDLVAVVDTSASTTDKVTLTNLAASSAFAGQYEPLGTEVYNWTPATTAKMRAALAKARTELVNVAFIGDSITAARLPTVPLDPATDAACQEVLRRLAADYTIAGDGVIPFRNIVGTLTTADTDGRLAFAGTWTSGNGYGVQSTAGASTITYVSTRAGTVVEVWHFNNSTSPFTVTIDGGGPVTVTPIAGATLGKYTVSGLADTVHTVEIARVAGTAQAFGVQVRGTIGISVANLGQGSARTTSYTPTDWFLAQSQQEFLDPDVVFLQLGVNDLVGDARSAADFKTNIKTLTAAYAAISATTAVVLVSSAISADFTAYRDALKEVADEEGLPLVDWNAILGGYTVANGAGLYEDVNHPNAAGQSVMGRALHRLIA